MSSRFLQETGRFIVELDDVEVDGWRRVFIPSSSTEVGTYRDSQNPEWEQKEIGVTTDDPLVMERLVSGGDRELFEWHQNVRLGNTDEAKRQVSVILTDNDGSEITRWEFDGAWVKDYDPPELDANSTSVPTETVTVVFDQMERTDVD